MLSLITHATRKESFKFPRPQFSHSKTKGNVVLGNNFYPAYLKALFEIIYMRKHLAKHTQIYSIIWMKIVIAREEFVKTIIANND